MYLQGHSTFTPSQYLAYLKNQMELSSRADNLCLKHHGFWLSQQSLEFDERFIMAFIPVKIHPFLDKLCKRDSDFG